MLETRQNRSAQVDVPGCMFFYGPPPRLRPVLETRDQRPGTCLTGVGGGFIPTGVPAVDAALADPSRHLPEPEQLAWLKDTVARSGRRWHLVGNQVMLTPVRWPGAALGVPGGVTLLNSDQWDGYQADQHDLLTHSAAQPPARGDVVVLTGDIHSSWAAELPVNRTATGWDSAGVEFVCPSVTSDGFYELVRATLPAGTPTAAALTATAGVVGAVSATNPWVRYLDGVGHGYTLIDVTPQRVQADFFHTPDPHRRPSRSPDRPGRPAGLLAQLPDSGRHPPAYPGSRSGRPPIRRAHLHLPPLTASSDERGAQPDAQQGLFQSWLGDGAGHGFPGRRGAAVPARISVRSALPAQGRAARPADDLTVVGHRGDEDARRRVVEVRPS